MLPSLDATPTVDAVPAVNAMPACKHSGCRGILGLPNTECKPPFGARTPLVYPQPLKAHAYRHRFFFSFLHRPEVPIEAVEVYSSLGWTSK